ncbi:hypothetical protein AB0H83_35300 [Dactylosporangium sp. NPDC050688]|uniref:hypothetical protein n=1 Tax=Dactylosporangium sp. NPDC050688 TaxID=3157217 RepID=UPI0033D358D6
MLYYPFAAAPTNVIQQAILYWDGLRTVVAPGWRSRLGPEMEAIRDRGFYAPIRPYRDYRRALTQDRVIPDLQQALSEIGPLDVQIPEEPPILNSNTMLYEGKLNPGVVDMLITQGYAVRHPDSPSRLYGSPRLMHMVISIMASRIAADNNWRHGSEGPESLYPHTDITTAFRLNVDPIAGRRVSDGWKVGRLTSDPSFPCRERVSILVVSGNSEKSMNRLVLI